MIKLRFGNLNDRHRRFRVYFFRWSEWHYGHYAKGMSFKGRRCGDAIFLRRGQVKLQVIITVTERTGI